MDLSNSVEQRLQLLYDDNAFRRDDEADDSQFYSRERMVSHLDALALETVQHIIGTLVVEPHPEILDLMASWDSHLPEQMTPARAVGLGLNPPELERNPRLTERVVHDLNREPRLPFADASFDVVLNTVSVDYLTRPFEVFREVGRVLRPGGLFLVLFSNRMFPQKAVRIWRETPDDKRVHLVEDYFYDARLFHDTARFVSKGRPRPADDTYSASGLPSDPVYAVWSNRLGATVERPSPTTVLLRPGQEERALVARRREQVARTLSCPHCEQRLRKWRVPQTPFTQWDNEFLHVCFNDSCPYLVRGWSVMAQQGNLSVSYRYAFDRDRQVHRSMPVHTLKQMRDGIVD